MQSLEQQLVQNKLMENKMCVLANTIYEASLLMLEINEELIRTEQDLEQLERNIQRKILRLNKQAANGWMLHEIIELNK